MFLSLISDNPQHEEIPIIEFQNIAEERSIEFNGMNYEN